MTHSPHPPFFAYSGSRQPLIVFVGEAFGANEDEIKRPFVGQSGRELFLMLGEALPSFAPEAWATARFGLGWVGARDAWAKEARVGFTNVLALRPPDNQLDALCVGKKELDELLQPNNLHIRANIQLDQGRYLHPQYYGEVDRLADELRELHPNLIVPLGNTACWALLGTRGITAIRGTVVAESLTGLEIKCLPTYHPQAVVKNWPWRQIAVGDFMKAGREASFSEIRRPERFVLVNPFIEEVIEWIEWAVVDGVKVACDTETAKGQITMVGFARSATDAIVVPFRNFIDPLHPLHYWEKEGDEIIAWRQVERLLLAKNEKIFQNGLYDIQYFLSMGMSLRNATEDTMLKHHAILPEMQKGLGFLGSVYTREPAWKMMRKRKKDEPEKADE